jgi:acyl-coenzyme A synthetase/AMP-(fatty) acid ligase
MQLLSSAKLIEGAVEYRLPPDPFLKSKADLSTRLLLYASKSPAAVAMVHHAFNHRIPYVPVDIKVPFERVVLLFNTVNPTWVLVERQSAFHDHIRARHRTEILWQDDSFLLLELKAQKNPEHNLELAAVLFTSGSTGIPKGVMITRENIQFFTEWMVKEYQVGPESKILSVSPLHFDLSLFEMFAVFTRGASLHFPPDHGLVNPMLLAEYMHQQKTDVIYATPSWYRLLVNYGKTKRYDFSFVTTVLMAGEALDEKLVKQLQALFPSARLANLYGPTETNVCLYYNLPAGNFPVRNGMVPVGNACPYARVALNNENILEVSGSTVMLGYWPEISHEKTYATGDIMEYDDMEKVYYFIGRKDGMVKRNGYRIELGEIEVCLARLEQVKEVAVTTIGTGEKLRIMAHLVAADLLDPDELRQHCLRYLPPYMIPDIFRQHQNFPLTGSGKTDYRKLAEYGTK